MLLTKWAESGPHRFSDIWFGVNKSLGIKQRNWTLAAPFGYPLFSRHPAGIESTTWTIDIYHQWRMIGRYRFAFTCLAVDFGPHDTCFQRCRYEQVVDTHAKVLVEISCAVVPPRVSPWFGMLQAVCVNKSPTAQARECFPFAFGDMRPTMTGAGIPHIDVFGCDIQIAAEHDWSVSIECFTQPASQPIKPGELRFIER